MIISQKIRRCVAFVGCKTFDGRYQFKGTVFFLSRISRDVGWFHPVYAVTAAHVIEKIRDLGCREVYLRLNYPDGTARWVETNADDWYFHPDKNVNTDVAVMPFMRASFGPEIDHDCYSIDSSVTQQVIEYFRVGPGEEVFVTGLFARHRGESKNIPIVRAGNLAAMREEPVLTKKGLMDAYLIESRSIGGLSGSPVFLYLGVDRPFKTGPASETFTMVTANDGYGVNYLLGMIHGHWDEEDQAMDITSDDADIDVATQKKVNMGIAIVTPAERILETMNHPKIKEAEDALIEAERKRDLPTEDVSDDEDALPFTGQDFEAALRKVSRRIEPSQSGEGK